MTQMLLFPDPKPLVEKLGRDFFLRAPETPGVYLMRDAADSVLYVGKAKNLRRRLGNYRVANPDRMPRRHLRLLRAVVRIELQQCADETAALARESELLRSLKPKFNRAGTWRAPLLFLVCRHEGHHLKFTMLEKPDAGWLTLNPTGTAPRYLRNALVRLFWCALYPAAGVCGMPIGWAHGQFADPTSISASYPFEECIRSLEELARGNSDALLDWLKMRLPDSLSPFEKEVIESDLEFLTNYLA